MLVTGAFKGGAAPEGLSYTRHIEAHPTGTQALRKNRARRYGCFGNVWRGALPPW